MIPSIKRYEITTNTGTKSITAKEREQIDTKKPDLFISSPDGMLAFRRESGEWVEHHGKWPGMGRVMLAVLQALMLNSGDFLTPADIASITGVSSLRENNNLSARVAALRRFFKDKDQRFIETRDSGSYAIRLPQCRTFLWVERVPAAAAGSS